MGYDPFKGYMKFIADKETADVRTRVENARHQRMLVGAGAFTVGLLVVMMTSRRDQKKREKGELVDAYWNQARQSATVVVVSYGAHARLRELSLGSWHGHDLWLSMCG